MTKKVKKIRKNNYVCIYDITCMYGLFYLCMYVI